MEVFYYFQVIMIQKNSYKIFAFNYTIYFDESSKMFEVDWAT